MKGCGYWGWAWRLLAVALRGCKESTRGSRSNIVVNSTLLFDTYHATSCAAQVLNYCMLSDLGT